MKRSVNTIFLAVSAFLTASCVVAGPETVKRTSEGLASYSNSRLVPLFAIDPVAAVIAAVDTDTYLSRQGEIDDQEMASLFPYGILHIDDRAIKINGVANVYPDGNGINIPGAKWEVDRFYDPYSIHADSDYLYYAGYEARGSRWALECISEGHWNVDLLSVNVLASCDQVHVAYVKEESGIREYTVTSSGSLTEYDYTATCSTGDDGVTIKFISNIDAGFSKWTMVPTAGIFNVYFSKGSQTLDYCYLTFAENGFSCETGLD